MTRRSLGLRHHLLCQRPIVGQIPTPRLLRLCEAARLGNPVQAPVRLPQHQPRNPEKIGVKHFLLSLLGIEYPERQRLCRLALIDKTEFDPCPGLTGRQQATDHTNSIA